MFPDVVAEVEGYIESRPNFSVEKFASQGKISERTVYRFLAGEKIAARSLMQILKVLHGNNHGEVLATLRSKYPEDRSLKKMEKFYQDKELSLVVDQYLKDFFVRNTSTYKTLCLLTKYSGLGREDIVAELGIGGGQLFDELLAEGKLIATKLGRYRLEPNALGFFDGKIAKALSLMLFNLYDPETYGTKDAQIGHSSGWVSQEGLTLIKETLIQAFIKCNQIEKENPGSIPFCVSTGMIKISERMDQNLYA